MKYLRLTGELVAFVVATMLLTMILGLPLLAISNPHEESILLYLLNEIPLLFAILASSWLLLKKNWLVRMGFLWKGHGRDVCWGLLVALSLYLLGFSLLLLTGDIEVMGVSLDVAGLFSSWLLMLLVALAEEAALRGFVLGRMLDVGMNRWLALGISSMLFSLLHLFNPNFAFLPFLNILLAGVMLGVSYIYTRNLWFPVSLHLFWNWLQGSVFGFPVSGNNFGSSLLVLHLPEENLMNGGAFGFEGSLPCTALMLVATFLIWRVASTRCAFAPCQSSVPEPTPAGES